MCFTQKCFIQVNHCEGGKAYRAAPPYKRRQALPLNGRSLSFRFVRKSLSRYLINSYLTNLPPLVKYRTKIYLSEIKNERSITTIVPIV